MNRHEVTVHITFDEFARVNRLLAIESLDDMADDELAAEMIQLKEDKNE